MTQFQPDSSVVERVEPSPNFDERPGLEAYVAPAPLSFGTYRTFCGT